jgi:putative membrane protein
MLVSIKSPVAAISAFSASFALAALLAVGSASAARAQGMGGQPPGGMSPPNAGDMGMGATAPTVGAHEAGDLAAGDRSFVLAAGRGGLAEVELGKLAVERAASPEVKAFGQKMVDDHSQADDRLRQVAAAKGLSLPSALDRQARGDRDRLAKLSGGEFDRAYIAMMVKDHTEDVAAFNHAANTGVDVEVRNFAAATLPVVKEHLSMARDLQAKVDKTAAR